MFCPVRSKEQPFRHDKGLYHPSAEGLQRKKGKKNGADGQYGKDAESGELRKLQRFQVIPAFWPFGKDSSKLLEKNREKPYFPLSLYYF